MFSTPRERRTNDEPQITNTYPSATGSSGYYILCKHPDGLVPCGSFVVLLGFRHRAMDVSEFVAPQWVHS